MQDLVKTIEAAVADGASGEAKTAGAQACRTLLVALEAEQGQPLGIVAVTPSPQTKLDVSQALDLVIAKLSAALPAEAKPTDPQPKSRAVRFALVKPNIPVARRK